MQTDPLEDNLRLILGLKVRQLRSAHKLSLKELSKESGLSISYLNEIEKGKKYPKADKALALARALNTKYEDLTSLCLSGTLSPLNQLLNTRFLQQFPLEQFGVTTSALMEFMSSDPTRFSTLITTIIRVARRYNLNQEQLNIAALRSLIEINQNYFPTIERAADLFRKKTSWLAQSPLSSESFASHLRDQYRYRIDHDTLASQPALASLRSAFQAHPKTPTLFLNKNLSESQCCFHLAREIAFQTLKLDERVNAHTIQPHDNFNQVFNNFQASYFAGCLLLPRKQLLTDLKTLFAQKKTPTKLLTELLRTYQVTPELLFHRLTHIIPRHLKLPNLFFTRIDQKKDRFKVTKELHFSRLHHAQASGLFEHYCRRWSPITLLEKTNTRPKSSIERVTNHDTQQEYLLFNIAYPSRINEELKHCVTLGLLIDPALKRTIKFWDDPKIPHRIVNHTCQRCSIADCQERAAPPLIFEKHQQIQKREQALRQLLNNAPPKNE